MFHSRIECFSTVSLHHTVNAHGWVKLAPWCWNNDNHILSRLERLRTGKLVLVEVSQSGRRGLRVQIDAELLGQTEQYHIGTIVKRWFSIDWDPRDAIRTAATLDERVARFIKDGGGRFLRGSTFYEDFVKTICTINTNWASTKRMASSLVYRLGGGVFPTPVTVIDYGEELLRQELRLGFRSRVVAQLSRELLDQGIVDCQGNLRQASLNLEDLLSLRGIGQYAGSYLMMLCHDFRQVPVDSEVTRYCHNRYDLEPEAIQAFFAGWGEYKFLGYKLSRIIDETKWEG